MRLQKFLWWVGGRWYREYNQLLDNLSYFTRQLDQYDERFKSLCHELNLEKEKNRELAGQVEIAWWDAEIERRRRHESPPIPQHIVAIADLRGIPTGDYVRMFNRAMGWCGDHSGYQPESFLEGASQEYRYQANQRDGFLKWVVSSRWEYDPEDGVWGHRVYDAVGSVGELYELYKKLSNAKHNQA